jgi:hypothetical protein
VIATGGMAAPVRLLARTGGEVPVRIPRGTAQKAAVEELSKPMYRAHEPGLLQRALDWLWQWIDDLFSTAAGVTPGGTTGVVVIILVVILLVAVLRMRLGALRRSPTTASPLFDHRPRSAAEHRAAAERHAADRQWDQAAQERLRAVVRSLEERALLDPRPGRTADEAAAEAGLSLPGHADRLRAAARDFDDITYGGRTATVETYVRLRDLDTDLQRSKPVLSTAGAGGAG